MPALLHAARPALSHKAPFNRTSHCAPVRPRLVKRAASSADRFLCSRTEGCTVQHKRYAQPHSQSVVPRCTSRREQLHGRTIIVHASICVACIRDRVPAQCRACVCMCVSSLQHSLVAPRCLSLPSHSVHRGPLSVLRQRQPLKTHPSVSISRAMNFQSAGGLCMVLASLTLPGKEREQASIPLV